MPSGSQSNKGRMVCLLKLCNKTFSQPNILPRNSFAIITGVHLEIILLKAVNRPPNSFCRIGFGMIHSHKQVVRQIIASKEQADKLPCDGYRDDRHLITII